METTSTRLPAICRAWTLDCRDLPARVRFSFLMGTPVPLMMPLTPVPLDSGGGYAVSGELTRGRTVFTHTLNLHTPGRVVLRPWTGFVVETIYGGLYLIGSREEPWPQTTARESAGVPGGDRAGTQIEVSLTALFGLTEAEKYTQDN